MPADPTGSDRPDGEARFRADLVAYLDSLSVEELGELLGELPSVGRGEPLRLGALMIALNERLPEACSCSRPRASRGPSWETDSSGRRSAASQARPPQADAGTTAARAEPPDVADG